MGFCSPSCKQSFCESVQMVLHFLEPEQGDNLLWSGGAHSGGQFRSLGVTRKAHGRVTHLSAALRFLGKM